MKPPKYADKLLQFFCAPHLLEEVQGDLYERYGRDLAEVGTRKANRRYVANVLKFIKPFALKRQNSAYPSPSFLHPVMIRNSLKTSFRNLTKNRVSALINLFGLSLGVTACLVIYLITNYELSYDTFHADRGRIYRLIGTEKFVLNSETRPAGFVPNPVPLEIRE